MYRVFRYKTLPNYWPASATVYVDKSPTRVDHYVTDNQGNPTLVYGGPGVPVTSSWGSITGTLSAQTDLQAALDSKYSSSNPAGYQTAAQVSTAISSGLTGYATQSWVTSQGYLTSQISHADVVVDGDFGSQGIMLRGASSGTYSILTDNSANWNTAFGWGNHASAGYLTAINSGMVTTALGFTPYNATNPSGYQTAAQVSTSIGTALTGYATESWVTSQGYLNSVTDADISTALGFMPISESDIIGLILCLG